VTTKWKIITAFVAIVAVLLLGFVPQFLEKRPLLGETISRRFFSTFIDLPATVFFQPGRAEWNNFIHTLWPRMILVFWESFCSSPAVGVRPMNNRYVRNETT
jgi:hypothetical protein